MLVGLGGFLGSVGRHGIGMLCSGISATFPVATLVVNLLGCFGIGFGMAMVGSSESPNNSLYLLLVVGMLGGFTTFSAFGYQTVTLLREGHAVYALGNVAAHTVFCLVAVVLGSWVAVR